MNLEEIVNKLSLDMQKNRHVHAMWLEGSYATGLHNEQSDIDVWMDIDDGMFEHVVFIFRKHLEKLGKIDWKETRGLYSENPKLMKFTFHLEGFPEEQVIELDLQEHSRKFIFSKREHTIKLLFDKDNTIQWKE